jgi:hypothetical protein
MLLGARCLMAWLLAAGTSMAWAVTPDSVFTVQGANGLATVRVLTSAASCPGIVWDKQAAQPMTLRVAPGTVAARADNAQADSKPAVFDVRVCEAAWPAGVQHASVEGQSVPAPHTTVERIVIVADTGCRMKASENAFQACNDAVQWPWAQVAQSAAQKHPDMVIHIGDIHYRESPCPGGNTGCADSPWGYGYDAWTADFFKPAQPLLAAAPWVFVRGNHEACFRAGQGWFRFVDAQAWSEQRSCNDPQNDGDADFSEPYAVPITPDTQLTVFDSAKTAGKAFSVQDQAYGKYLTQVDAVDALVLKKPHNFFLSHHPLLAVAPMRRTGDALKPGGNAGLLSVFGARHPARLFADPISVVMHGHIHVFESLSFESAHPASLVLGNSGSVNEGVLPGALPARFQVYPGAVVQDYAQRTEFGFATLDRLAAADHWLLTEYTTGGVPVLRCTLAQGKSHCATVSPE